MNSSRVAVIGSGPAALMAAERLSRERSLEVTVYEKRKSAGRKLLIAGSSGLNISNSLPVDEFAKHYAGPNDLWLSVLKSFSVRDWLSFIEKDLGIGTFEGSSGRYFVENMKASKLLQAWTKRLEAAGVRFRFDAECVDWKEKSVRFSNGVEDTFDAICFALGGGSYEPGESPLRWPSMFLRNGVGFSEFQPSNVGYEVKWKEAFLEEADGKPLKRVALKSSRGVRMGDAMVTRYGLEGTPVYFVGERGTVHLDLLPDLSAEQIESKLLSVKENYSPIRRIGKQLGLSEAAFALVFHHAPAKLLSDLKAVSRYLKEFPLEFLQSRPLTESISSSGGIQMSELDARFMLKRHPGVFAVGEMLDWDVPTGGFLIQGCVSQGWVAGSGILDYLEGSYA